MNSVQSKAREGFGFDVALRASAHISVRMLLIQTVIQRASANKLLNKEKLS